MHRLNIKNQLGMSTNRVRICDGRADDDDVNRNLHGAFWGVRNNDNVGINRPRAISNSRLSHIGSFMISGSGFVTLQDCHATGLSASSATPSRS